MGTSLKRKSRKDKDLHPFEYNLEREQLQLNIHVGYFYRSVMSIQGYPIENTLSESISDFKQRE